MQQALNFIATYGALFTGGIRNQENIRKNPQLHSSCSTQLQLDERIFSCSYLRSIKLTLTYCAGHAKPENYEMLMIVLSYFIIFMTLWTWTSDVMSKFYK